MAEFFRLHIGDITASHEQWVEAVEMYQGTEAYIFTESMLEEYGDGMRAVVSSEWWAFMDSAMMFVRFLWKLDKALDGRDFVCYPVINGVPRLCFAPQDAPIACYLTDDEKLRYSHHFTDYTQYKVTYLPDLHVYGAAVGLYLSSLPQRDEDMDKMLRDYPGKRRP